MKKWSSLALAVTLGAVLTLSGCGGNNNASTESTAGSNAAATAAPESSPDSAATSQDTLILGRGGDSASLDPAIVTDGESLKIAHQVFDSLLEYKPGTSEVQASLADSWEVSADGLIYTFKLHPGVKFHDGSDFDAEAVVFNFTRWSDPASEYKFEGDSFDYYDSMFGPDGSRVIKEVKAVDATTVQFVLNQPQAPFLQNIAMTSFGIASPTAIKEKKENFKNEPVGTGPLCSPNGSTMIPLHWTRIRATGKKGFLS